MSLATRIGEEFNLVRDEGMARLKALASYNGIIGTDTKQQQENLVFSTTVGNEYKLADMSRFRKIDGKVIDTYGPELIKNGDFSTSDLSSFTNDSAGGVVMALSGNDLLKVTTSIQRRLVKQLITGLVIGHSYTVTASGVTYDTAVSYLTLSAGISEINCRNGDSGIVDITNKKGTFTLKATSTSMYIGVQIHTGAGVAYFDNISVREVQTIDFSRSGQHPFEVYTNTALTAPNNVLAGDYVVVDTPELVTNGTFDTDDGTFYNYSAEGSNASSNISGGQITVTNASDSTYNYLYINQPIQFYKDVPVVLSFELISTTASGIYPRVGTLLGQTNICANIQMSIDAGFKTATLTPNQTSIGYISIGNGGSAIADIGAVTVYDNISVKRVDDTYRAKIDAPSGTALTNTTYFETRNYISNQVLAMQKADGTIHTETLFVDAYAVETTNAILASNGWSKLENGLYSKGDIVASPIGYAQC